MIDRHRFFTSVRHTLFGADNTLTQDQVNGCNTLLDEFERRYPKGDYKKLSYYLATAYWETNQTMQPVREAYYISNNFETAEAWRKAHLWYYPWYGRGYVQLTLETNYIRESQADRTGVDLHANKELALDSKHAANIMFVGMEHGDYGGGPMSGYFSDTVERPKDARHLVNGTDHAAEIADIYWKFKAAIVDELPSS